VIICVWLAVLMTGCTTDSSRRVSVPNVADTLKVLPNETLSFAARAKGVQIYESRATTNDALDYEWVLKAPEAGLFDAQGKRIGAIKADRPGRGLTAVKSWVKSKAASPRRKRTQFPGCCSLTRSTKEIGSSAE
jgi:hypothetical protein